MSDELSFSAIEEQHTELLPARTVMSMFSAGVIGNGSNGSNGSSNGGDDGGDATDGNSGVVNSLPQLSEPGVTTLTSDRALKLDITPVDWSR